MAASRVWRKFWRRSQRSPRNRNRAPPAHGETLMSDHASKEMLPANLEEHRAFKAWCQLQPKSPAPGQIEILKLKSKSAVYRLAGVGPDRSTVVAKRCPAEAAAGER